MNGGFALGGGPPLPTDWDVVQVILAGGLFWAAVVAMLVVWIQR